MSAKATKDPEAAEAAQAALALPPSISVRELAELVHASPVEVIKELIKNGVMAAINQNVDYAVAAVVAQRFGFQVRPQEEAEAGAAKPAVEEEDASQLQPRPPIVTVMGHVDHGKTSLLDVIRQTHVTAREAGGITQHIGAYQVEEQKQRITFIDTPGHEAFTAMRARGAKATDIAVLVVAADDGVMPQTVEAIDHAKAAQVPIIVAINKVDLPDADPERVKQQLTEHGLVVEEWGGDVIAVPVSAKAKQGVDLLLENILLVAEISELKANPDRPAAGTIIEAELDPSKGPMATVLVRAGTLHVGDVVVAGDTWGRMKALFNEHGQRMKEAGPSLPVRVLGLVSVPRAGDPLEVVSDEKAARAAAEEKETGRAGARAASRPAGTTLEAVSGDIAAGRAKELTLVLKADVQGSVEAIQATLEKLSSDQVRVNIIHTGTGKISESDVMLALASKAIVIGFNVKEEPGVHRLAEAEGIDIHHYTVIYQLIEDMEKASKGLLEPVTVEVVDGQAEVRALFRVRGARVAGSYVTDGSISRGSACRVLREGEVIHTSRIASLRRFKEDVRQVQTGYECGIVVEGFDDFKEGDVIEAFHGEPQA
ncbi:MAG: translation initiation factor IF-2 [Dehalococcoidia bacterium]